MERLHLKAAQALANIEEKDITVSLFQDFMKLFMPDLYLQPFLRLRGHPSILFFKDIRDKENAEKGELPDLFLPGELAENSLITFRLPENYKSYVLGDSIINEIILNAFKNVVKEAASFFSACCDKQTVPFKTIEDKFTYLYGQMPLKLVETADGAEIKLIETSFFNMTFEDTLDLNLYLTPMLKGQAKLWLRSRRCKECNKLFFYIRSSAQYCSDICRIHAAYKQRSKL